eukprot:c28714_g1_i4 orf=637-1455(-)
MGIQTTLHGSGLSSFMERKKLTGKEKKLKRKEELMKKKAVDEAVKAAYTKQDHLVDFPAFRNYDRNGLAVRLESSSGEHLSGSLKQYIQELLKINMEGPYGPDWSAEEKVKRREMVAVEACYIIVRKLNTNCPKGGSQIDVVKGQQNSHCGLWRDVGDPVVAFVQYRFLVEEELPVLYVYELQLEQCVQGRGLGKFLMQLLELIAHRNNMKSVMLTVQKRNTLAMNFYIRKLRYTISSVSPSRVDPVIAADKNYEILCKAFDPEAKSKLEVC